MTLLNGISQITSSNLWPSLRKQGIVLCWPWLGIDQIKFQSLGISGLADIQTAVTAGVINNLFNLIVWSEYIWNYREDARNLNVMA